MNMPSRLLFLSAVLLILHGCAGRGTDGTTAKPKPEAGSSTTGSVTPDKPLTELNIASGPGIAERPDVQAFIGEISRKHGFDPKALSKVFAGGQF